MGAARRLSILLVCAVSWCKADLAEKFLSKEYSDFWLLRLLMNLLGYATVFVPGYFLIQYYRRIKYNEQKKGRLPYLPSPTLSEHLGPS